MNQLLTQRSIVARRVLDRYAAGERNFQGQNLRGVVLRGQCLCDADFSQADIRGADFSNANLSRVRFRQAKAGVGQPWQWTARLLASILGLMFGFLSTRLAVPLVSSDGSELISGIASIMVLGLLCWTINRFSLLKGVTITLLLAALVGMTTGILAVIFDYVRLGIITLYTAETTVLCVGVVGVFHLGLPIAQALTKHSTLLACVSAVMGAISVPTLASGPLADNLTPKGTVFAIIISLIVVRLGARFAQQVLSGESRHALMRSFTIGVAAALGTRFRNANLTEVDFAQAQLCYTDLGAACLDYGRWDGAYGLALARWGNSPMADPVVQSLLVWRDLKGQFDLSRANLAGMDLSYLNLQGANFKGANLLCTNLRGSNLSHANLTLAQGLGADFSQATLTGACIEGWAIDSHTCLADVTCQFVYRLEFPRTDTDDRERYPSSGVFNPGDFTKLFQVVLNTVELIFRNGIDRGAIAKTLEHIQATVDDRINLRSVEDTGDGLFKIALGIPDGMNKAQLHHEFKSIYQEHLRQIENRYQAQLSTAQQQIEHYQKTTSELTHILRQLTNSSMLEVGQAATDDRRVILTFWDGSLEQGYPVTADIRLGALAEPLKFHASLPPIPDLAVLYQEWQTLYRQAFGNCSRIQFKHHQEITNVSHQELYLLAERLVETLQSWLRSPTFRLISDKLREKFLPDQEIRILIQTEDIWLRRLPWHTWHFLQDYPKVEIALSGMTLENNNYQRPTRRRTRVLAVLGSSSGIDVGVDQQLLEALGRSNIDVVFLSEPNRKQFHDTLWDRQGWDVFYFSGHSYSEHDGHSGVMQLNAFEQLSIKDLQFALSEAVEQGLQLAILNSCDGLGLAKELCALKIPQIVVMKEAVPDQVAQSFLEYLLQALTTQKSLYSAIREARQQLSSLEDQYPFASWLPTLFQTTTEAIAPRLSSK
ncbi:pentapeptide repeat-containing protein [Oscillatoria sp. CS-180]|nr:pentapeptide repeat-containing protein [Oscillatoria sp. CS-180]